MTTSTEPEFFICVECETPLYTFEWDSTKERLTEALCNMCGNDATDDFQTEEEFMGEE